jgi:hypothetical protein
MEIVEITVEYASGMVITDQASFSRELEQVFPSERLASLLREFSATEAPPVVNAVIDGLEAPLDHRVDGSFAVGAADAPNTEQQGRPEADANSAWKGVEQGPTTAVRTILSRTYSRFAGGFRWVLALDQQLDGGRHPERGRARCDHCANLH